jgi:hypothetical protein
MVRLLPLLFALAADTPQPDALLQQMKTWLEPPRSSTRTLEMTVRSGAAGAAHWKARQARGSTADGNFVLTVLLEPADVRGTALLVQEQVGTPIARWLYVPELRRVRKLQPPDEFASFLNTEFTVSDLGFVAVKDRTLSLLGNDTLGGRAAYKLQEVPADRRTFSRIVTWVAADTKQPLKREYYDPADRLWLVETFEDVATVHDVGTAQRVRIEDVQTGYGSEYRVKDLAYDVRLPAAIFDWRQLAKTAEGPAW